jgi:ribose 5-phosphate isomerase RpiB
MPTKSEICQMLTELCDQLQDCGIETIRGNSATEYTTKLILTEVYGDDARNVIANCGFPAEVVDIGEGVLIIKPVY